MTFCEVWTKRLWAKSSYLGAIAGRMLSFSAGIRRTPVSSAKFWLPFWFIKVCTTFSMACACSPGAERASQAGYIVFPLPMRTSGSMICALSGSRSSSADNVSASSCVSALPSGIVGKMGSAPGVVSVQRGLRVTRLLDVPGSWASIGEGGLTYARPLRVRKSSSTASLYVAVSSCSVREHNSRNWSWASSKI